MGSQKRDPPQNNPLVHPSGFFYFYAEIRVIFAIGKKCPPAIAGPTPTRSNAKKAQNGPKGSKCRDSPQVGHGTIHVVKTEISEIFNC